jgi:hypothetical protein
MRPNNILVIVLSGTQIFVLFSTLTLSLSLCAFSLESRAVLAQQVADTESFIPPPARPLRRERERERKREGERERERERKKVACLVGLLATSSFFWGKKEEEEIQFGGERGRERKEEGERGSQQTLRPGSDCSGGRRTKRMRMARRKRR